MLKRTVFLLALLLLLFPTFALEVEKTIEGPKELDVNESLAVRILLRGNREEVKQIIDPIPQEFFPKDYPPFCHYEENKLVCDLDTELRGVLTINYNLVAVSSGVGFITCPSVVYSGGVKSCDLLRQYLVGKPKISFSFLYNSTVPAGFSWEVIVILKNEGVSPAKNVKILLFQENATVLSRDYNISGGEVYIVRQTLPPLKAGEKTKVSAVMIWNNETVRKEATITAAAPGCEISRIAKVFWIWKDGRLVPELRSLVTVRNTGLLTGNYTLVGVKSFVLRPGEVEFINIKEEDLTARSLKLICRDLFGNVHGSKVIKEEKVKATKDFVVILFEKVFIGINPWLLLLIAVFLVELSLKYKKEKSISAAFLIGALIALFGFFTHLYVLHLPLPAGKTLFESLAAHRERNIAGELLQALLNLLKLSSPIYLLGKFLGQ